MSRSLGYQLNVPMEAGEAKRRRLEAGLGRILVWAPEGARRVGLLQLPEILYEVLFDALAAEGGVFAQPLNSHVALTDYCRQLEEMLVTYTLYPSTPDRSVPRVLTVQCAQPTLLARSVNIFRCETIAVFPAIARRPEEELLSNISAPVPDNQWASAYLKYVELHEIFGFLSQGHDNVEFLGLRSRILKTFGKLVREYEEDKRE